MTRWRKELGSPDFKRVKGELTAHSLIRYAERFDGYDFEAAKNALLTDEVVDKIGKIGGDGKFSLNGIFYVVKNGKIITVAKAEGVKAHLTYAPSNGERGRRWTFD